jgi:hypothetical protein
MRQRRAGSRPIPVGLFLLLVMTAPPGLHAQADAATLAETTNVAEHVSDLVVSIRTELPGSVVQAGAGIIVGATQDSVYIVTAKHVLVDQYDPDARPTSLTIQFWRDTTRTVDASIRMMAEGEVDIAVIAVANDDALAEAGYRAVEDRLGDATRLGPGAKVSPVGCPPGNCWKAPTSPDGVLASSYDRVFFETSFVQEGSSGGGLFNEWDEVVGMVTRLSPPGAIGYPINYVTGVLRSEGVPVTLSARRIPRRGYGTSVGAVVLAPPTGGSFPDGRAHSARVTYTTGLSGRIQLNVGGLRLAPGGLGGACPPSAAAGAPLPEVIALLDRKPCEAVVNALVAGLGVRIQRGRLELTPFAEAGVGRVRGRYDLGGVYRFDEDFTLASEEVPSTTYVPRFEAVEKTGFGAGFGVTIDYVLFPRTILEGVVGQWRFRDPFEGTQLPTGYKPKMPTLFMGIGLRMGL